MASIVAARQGAPANELQIRGTRSAPPMLLSMPSMTTGRSREILDDADAVDQEADERYGKPWRSADAVPSMLERVGSGGSTTPTGGLTSG
jgi:hypothetical protein